jgi:cytochrome bd-type quinol oxidase subunit 1
VIYGVMRTRDAVTPVGDVPVSLAGFAVLYFALSATLILLLRRLARGESAAHPSSQASAADVRV